MEGDAWRRQTAKVVHTFLRNALIFRIASILLSFFYFNP